MFKVYVLLQLAFVSVLGNVAFHDCGSTYDLVEVNIEGCNDEVLCYVTAGEDLTVSFDFYANFVSLDLDQDVVINLNYYNLRPTVTPERCGIYNADCTVMTSTKNTITSVLTVPYEIVLNQRGFLTWRILNEQGIQVLCYRVTVQTQSRLQKLLREYLKTSSTARDGSLNPQLK